MTCCVNSASVIDNNTVTTTFLCVEVEVEKEVEKEVEVEVEKEVEKEVEAVAKK